MFSRVAHTDKFRARRCVVFLRFSPLGDYVVLRKDFVRRINVIVALHGSAHKYSIFRHDARFVINIFETKI